MERVKWLRWLEALMVGIIGSKWICSRHLVSQNPVEPGYIYNNSSCWRQSMQSVVYVLLLSCCVLSYPFVYLSLVGSSISIS